MKLFKDSQGREWKVEANVAGLMRVKDLVGVNLMELSKGDPPLGAQLTTDPFLVANVLAALVRPQLETSKTSADQFLEGIDGPAFALAFAAMTEELMDFFRRSGRGEQAAALTAQMQALTMAAEVVRKKVEALDVKAMVDAHFREPTTAT